MLHELTREETVFLLTRLLVFCAVPAAQFDAIVVAGLRPPERAHDTFTRRVPFVVVSSRAMYERRGGGDGAETRRERRLNGRIVGDAMFVVGG